MSEWDNFYKDWGNPTPEMMADLEKLVKNFIATVEKLQKEKEKKEMSKNLKEFEKYIREKNTINGNQLPISVGVYISEKDGWIAALEMIYYKGVLANTLAGDLIKEELGNENL